MAISDTSSTLSAAQPLANGVISGDRFRSLTDLRAAGAKAASALHDMGVWQGDIVALLLRNDFVYFEASAGAMLLGASTVPLNWHLTSEEIGYILDDCGAKVLLAHADLLTEGVLAVTSDIQVVAVDTPPEIAQAYGLKPEECQTQIPVPVWDQWLESYAPWRQEPRQVIGPMFYTSGTSGQPKGVKRKAVAPDVATRAEQRSRFAWGLDAHTVRTVVTGPLYHSAPNAYAMMTLFSGGLLVLQPRFDAENLLQLIAQHQITHLHMVPTMFVRLLGLPEVVRAQHDLSSLQHVSHGAAPCAESVKRAMIQWWGKIIHEYYAMTETGIICSSDSETWLSNPGCVGKAVPGIDLLILTEDDRRCQPGEAGEICVRSEVTSMVSYHRAQDKTEKLRRGDYLATGDIGYLDPNGVLFISDRRSDMVISGGVNIYPAEIENALHQLPEISDCAAFGIPDEEFGERMVLVVTGSDLPDSSALLQHLEQHLATYKLPRSIYQVTKLPREDSGKIKKRLLKEQVVQGNLKTL